jgi:hypothetical protein
MGGYATSWSDIVCIKCDSSYEIKSKASTEKIEKAIRYNNIQGGSFKRFHRLRREEEGNEDAKHYLVLVSRAPSEIICASVACPRTSWQVDLAEIDTVLPALRDASFTRPAGGVELKSSIKIKEGTRKVWFRIPFVEIDQRGIAREVFDEYYETETKTVKIEKLHAKMGDKPEGEDAEPVPAVVVRSSTPTVSASSQSDCGRSCTCTYRCRDHSTSTYCCKDSCTSTYCCKDSCTKISMSVQGSN